MEVLRRQFPLRKSFFLFLSLCLSSFSSLFSDAHYSLVDCSNVYLDQKLIQLMNYRNGVFIEVGAHDGITQSNTKLLEESYGWTGILIEPSSVLFEALVRNRPGSRCFQCALGSLEENGTLASGDFDGRLMSSINGTRLHRGSMIQVPMRSLQSILDEVGVTHINLFSLDTEGYEYNILRGVDFSRTTFDYLLIEIYKTEYEQIVSFLDSQGYKLISNFSNYSKRTNPHYDGTHNDYLFKRANLN